MEGLSVAAGMAFKCYMGSIACPRLDLKHPDLLCTLSLCSCYASCVKVASRLGSCAMSSDEVSGECDERPHEDGSADHPVVTSGV